MTKDLFMESSLLKDDIVTEAVLPLYNYLPCLQNTPTSEELGKSISRIKESRLSTPHYNPSVLVADYISEVITMHPEFHVSVVAYAVIYLKRISMHDELWHYKYWFRKPFFFVAYMLAAKHTCIETYHDNLWAEYSMIIFTVENLKEAEEHVTKLLELDGGLYISPELLAKKSTSCGL